MKVKAINIDGAKNITLNKVYEVLNETAESYIISNDLERNGTYKKIRFEEVVEQPTVVYRAGMTLTIEDDSNEKIMIINADFNLVALVDLNNGELLSRFIPVSNVDNITEEELDNMSQESFGEEKLIPLATA